MDEPKVFTARDVDSILGKLTVEVGCRKAQIMLTGILGDLSFSPVNVDLHALPLDVTALAIACTYGGLCFGAPGGRSDCPLLFNESAIKRCFE